MKCRDIFSVEIDGEKAIVWGAPEPDDESHDCDAMGCPSIAHIVAIVPIVATTRNRRTDQQSSTVSAGEDRP